MKENVQVVRRPGERIVISGNLAAGKTTLGRKLGRAFRFRFEGEFLKENPYLSDFYREMSSWAFHLQLYFLGHRVSKYRKAMTGGYSAIFDRSVYEDGFVFAPLLHEAGHISDRDYQTYQTLFRTASAELEPPRLIVYLHAPIPVLLNRIARRRQEFEKGVNADYLQAVETRYSTWINSVKYCPVIRVNTEEADIRRAADFKHLVSRITGHLAL